MTVLDIIYVSPTTFDGIARVVSPWSASWLNWWVIAAMACLFVAVLATPRYFSTRLPSLLGLQRQYSIFQETSLTDIRTVVAGTLFTLISLSLALFLTNYGAAPFSHKAFLVTMLEMLAWLTLKGLLMLLVLCVFFPSCRFSEIMQTVAQLYFFTAVGLFAACLCKLYFLPDYERIEDIVLIATLLAAAIVTVLKIIQFFLTKNLGYLYIFLYLCTLEILPFIVLVKGYLYLQNILLG